MFSLTSRYYGIETAEFVTPAGQRVKYARRRLIPPAEHFSLLQEHVVSGGERLDNITAQYLGDPEQFWRICDANNVIDPDELTRTVGSRIRITLPEGVPGAPHA